MAPSPIRVAVNLSPRQFSDERLVIEIAHALAQTELPAHLLEIEITESMMMENPERAAETLREIKEMGVHVSIDDFGTGYSSLARLKKFPIESVKIDRSFIRDIAVDPDDAAIVSAVIAMAHSLRLKVIAEGVETQDQVSSCASAAATRSRASTTAARSRRRKSPCSAHGTAAIGWRRSAPTE